MSPAKKKRPSTDESMPEPKRCRVSAEEAEAVAGGVVNVLVGPLSTPFYVHEYLLRGSAQYWDKRLISQRAEGSSDLTLGLPHIEPRVFAIYTRWLYSKMIATSGSDFCGEHENLAMAYIFGGQIFDHDFQNMIIDAIIEVSLPPVQDEDQVGYLPSHFMISHLYGYTTPQDPVRRLLVDIYASGCADIDTKKIHTFLAAASLPTEFLHDLVVKLFSARTKHPKPKGHDYHHSEATEVKTETSAT